ncbi:ABC transporter permease [candidate division KSB1 bacterium]
MKGKKKHHPPLISRWLLNKLSYFNEEYSVTGDFDEIFFRKCNTTGYIKAGFWYRLQAMRSIPLFLINYIFWSLSMLKNYFKIAFRNIKRQKGYSFINISGLAIGMTCCILILLYIQYELSYDTYHEDADSVFMVVKYYPSIGGQSRIGVTPRPLAPTLKEEFPEVINASRVIPAGQTLIKYRQKVFYENFRYFVDQDFLNIFRVKFLAGDPLTALDSPRKMVITRKIAEKYFGDEDALGKVLLIGNSTEYTITGIIEDIPYNTHFRFEILASFSTLSRGYGGSSWDSNSFYTYIRLNKNSDPEVLQNKLPGIIDKYLETFIGRETTDELRIIPIKSIHLMGGRGHLMQANSDIRYIYLLIAIGVLIILIAGFNYMNLSTARAAGRAKEIGLRKVVGAKKIQLVNQYLGESVLMTVFAMFISLALAILMLPAFSAFIERKIIPDLFYSIDFLAGLFVLTVIIGITSGIYPALFISAFKPVTILKGGINTDTKKSGIVRNWMVVMQFTITIIMIICSIVIYNQLRFINKKNLGFKKDHIVVIPTRDSRIRANLNSLKTELLQSPKITGCSSHNYLPNRIVANTEVTWEGKSDNDIKMIFRNYVDYNYVNTFEMEITDGKNFSLEEHNSGELFYIVNETAVKNFGWTSPVGKRILIDSTPGTIVGVVKDFYYRKLDQKLEPLSLILEPGASSMMSVKINSNKIKETLEFIESKFKKFSPDFPFTYEFFDEVIDNVYRSEQKLGKMFRYFTFIAVFLSCLGLYGFASFATEQRRKELGIRKVLGASSSNLTLLLSREFTKWVVIANTAAWPIGYYAMNKWLQNFAYRIDVGFLTLTSASLLALIMAIFTISFQSIKAAVANPVDSLRNE